MNWKHHMLFNCLYQSDSLYWCCLPLLIIELLIKTSCIVLLVEIMLSLFHTVRTREEKRSGEARTPRTRPSAGDHFLCFWEASILHVERSDWYHTAAGGEYPGRLSVIRNFFYFCKFCVEIISPSWARLSDFQKKKSICAKKYFSIKYFL